jgi:hypothetical protein
MDKMQYMLIAFIVVLVFGMGWSIVAYCKETAIHKANLVEIQADLERLKAKEERIIRENQASKMKNNLFELPMDEPRRNIHSD